jgi:ATP-dependent RNA helicase RhlE
MSFDSFDLDPRCQKVLARSDITTPTPVQKEAIPLALTGNDLVAVAQTGTGKTLGFSLPSLTRLVNTASKHNRMLVLVPTRELCVQVYEVIRDLSKALHLKAVQIYGGVGFDQQARTLQSGVDIIVATPGRLIDHMQRKNILFKDLEILVLDEADRMLDMGFIEDIEYVMRKLPKDRQTLMFSATFPDSISRLAERMMNDPQRITIGAISKPVDKVRQKLFPVKPENKNRLLLDILENDPPNSALIFLRTKERTERLTHILHKKGFNITQIHGDRSQRQRQQALDGFKKGKFKLLAATDVASRGLDIDNVSHVFNFDIPENPDDYIHRIGRTARAESDGDAITFVTPMEFQALGAIETALGENIPREEREDAPRVLKLFKGSNGSNSASRKRGIRRGTRRR